MYTTLEITVTIRRTVLNTRFPTPPYQKGGVAAPCFLGRSRGGYLQSGTSLEVTTPSAPQKTRRSHPSFLIRRGFVGLRLRFRQKTYCSSICQLQFSKG